MTTPNLPKCAHGIIAVCCATCNQDACAVCEKALCECLDHNWKGAFIDTESDAGAWADAMLFPPYTQGVR